MVDEPSVSSGPRLLGPADVRSLASALDLRPTKQRGQNFVIDANTVRRIVRASEVTTDDVVLEVGPGLGSLTLALLEVA
jgi:16S rRNA (adenine1518-N6/adenine1519-N6)-dimethyltransferase